MRRFIVLCVLTCVLLILFSGIVGAQTPVPPTHTPYPTYTPYLTSAAPGPTATPPFSQLTEKQIPWWLTGLVGLICLVLGFMLKPVFERLGNAVAERLSRLGSGQGFKKRYLNHLIEQYRWLNIRGLKTKAPVTMELEQVYIPLHVQMPDTALGRREMPLRWTLFRRWRYTSGWPSWAALARARPPCWPT